MADHFSQSRHATTFAMLGVPGCATCHNNHEIQAASDSMLGLTDGAVCRRCHSPEDRGGQAASQMRRLIDSLRTDFDSVSDILLRAEQAGMEVSEAQFELSGAQSALVTARAAVHSFNVELVSTATDEGFAVTAEAHGHGLDALADLQFRRMGLAVSVTIILVLIAGLYLKLREIERKGS
jgi:predicted CXXCH cytochrome family protein